MKKQEIINLYSDFLENKTNNLFVNEVTPYDLHKLYNGALLYKSSWTDLFYSQIETELSNGMISRVPPTLSPDKMWPYSYVGGFSTEELYIPDSIIQHTKVNIEINLPNEMLLAPSVLEWDRDASFQMLAYYDAKEQYENGGITDGLSPIFRGTPHRYEFWNPSWSYEDWRRVWLEWYIDEGYEVITIPPYPYYRFTYSLPCYFLKSSEFLSEGEGDTTIYTYMLVSTLPPKGEEFGVDHSLLVIILDEGYTFLLESIHDNIPTGSLYERDNWFFSNQFVRPGYKRYATEENVPIGDGWVEAWSGFGNYYNKGVVLSPIGPDCNSVLSWPSEKVENLESVWKHQKPYTQTCPQETSYSFRKLGTNKWQIVGHVRISIMSLATHEVGTSLDGDNAPILYTAGQPESIKPQIRVTACIFVPDNITTGYIRTKS